MDSFFGWRPMAPPEPEQRKQAELERVAGCVRHRVHGCRSRGSRDRSRLLQRHGHPPRLCLSFPPARENTRSGAQPEPGQRRLSTPTPSSSTACGQPFPARPLWRCGTACLSRHWLLRRASVGTELKSRQLLGMVLRRLFLTLLRLLLLLLHLLQLPQQLFRGLHLWLLLLWPVLFAGFRSGLYRLL